MYPKMILSTIFSDSQNRIFISFNLPSNGSRIRFITNSYVRSKTISKNNSNSPLNSEGAFFLLLPYRHRIICDISQVIFLHLVIRGLILNPSCVNLFHPRRFLYYKILFLYHVKWVYVSFNDHIWCCVYCSGTLFCIILFGEGKQLRIYNKHKRKSSLKFLDSTLFV